MQLRKQRWNGRLATLMSSALVASLAPLLASAQTAPLGDHYAGRASDTGYAGAVSASGGYSASVPLDLPQARNGLPIPLQVVYGDRGMGAAGLGWDVPLSFIRIESSTIAHRRPVDALGDTVVSPLKLGTTGE